MRNVSIDSVQAESQLSEDWCTPEDMETCDYLMIEPACEKIEKSTGETSHGKKILKAGPILHST